MAQEDQHPSGHGSDMGSEFSAGEHDATHHDVDGEGNYTSEGRQGWDTPATPDDGFGDPEAAESGEDESQPPAKSRGGLLLPLLLFVLVMGAGGFAYWQFGMDSGQSLAQRQRDDVPAVTAAPEKQPDITPPVPPVPPSVAQAPQVVPMPEPVSLPTAMPPAAMPPAETVVAQGTLSPELPKAAPMPVTLPPPPLLDQADLDKPGTIAEPPASVTPPSGQNVVESPIPANMLGQKPPSVALPQSASGDKAAAVHVQEKAALEQEIVRQKDVIATLNEKVRQLQEAAASQDKVLKQTQSALKDTMAKAATAVAKVVAPVEPVQAKKPATSEKPLKQAKKPSDKKQTAAATTGKKAAAKKPETVKASAWVLRSVSAGTALISTSGSSSEFKEIHVGDVVPGLGTIKAITKKSGQWVVVGSKNNLK
ncbi:MAG: hypothetical protein WBK91_05845 [Alphaproteobacteria bacterium]